MTNSKTVPNALVDRREAQFPTRERAFRIPEAPREPAEVLDQIARAARRSPNDYASGLAFAKPGTLPDSIALHAYTHMIEIMNPNNIDGHMFLGAYELEKEILAQTAHLLGKRDEETLSDGFMLGGATESINQALWMLRNKYFREHAKVHVDEEGIAEATAALMAQTGRRSPVILTALDSHFSTSQKAPALLGLGREAVRFIPLNEQYGVSLEDVARVTDATLVEGRDIFAYVGTVGDTQKGRIDDIAQIAGVIADRTNRAGRPAPPTIVDAAAQYLFAAVMQESHRHGKIPEWNFRVPSVEAIIADPHKNEMPYNCGLLLLRNQLLAHETHVEPTYLSRDLQQQCSSLTDHERADAQINATIPTSRAGYGAAALWAYYQAHGMEGIRMRKEGIWQLAQTFAQGIREGGLYEIVRDPETSVVSFRTRDNSGERMARIYEAINTNPHDKLYIAKSTTATARTRGDLEVARSLGSASPFTALHVHMMEHNRPAGVDYLLERLHEEARRNK